MSGEYRPMFAIATAMLELGVAMWAITGPGRRNIVTPAVLILVLLAGYQLAEVLVCRQPGNLGYAKLALIDVLFLPPLGIWLLVQLGGSDNQRLVLSGKMAIATAGGIGLWVWMDPQFVTRSVCELVLARYHTRTPLYTMYATFYLAGLWAMLVGAAMLSAQTPDRTRREHIADVQVGTLLFVVPALLLQLLNPSLIGTTPSMMCHFAVFLALFLWRMVRRERAWAVEARVQPWPRPLSLFGH